ncbi:MAG: DUF2029 domain-containing protein [Armatimonadetes bacterium]|nr:DUF2029 domain-containing protein [Armatimonadota bacterium]
MTALRRALADHPRLRGGVVVAGTVLLGLVCFGPYIWWRAKVVPGHPEQHNTDFTCYTTAAREFLHGGRPYDVVNPGGLNYLYPPLLALLVAPLAGLREQPQALCWLAFSLACLAGCWLEAERLCRLQRGEGGGAGPPAPWWVAAGAPLAVGMQAQAALRFGQVSPLLLLLLLSGYRLARHGRSAGQVWAGGFLLAFATVLKATPALPAAVLWLLLAAAPRRPDDLPRGRPAPGLLGGLAAGAVVWALLFPACLLGWRANLAYLGEWLDKVALSGDPAGRLGWLLCSTLNQSLTNGLRLLGTTLWATPPPAELAKLLTATLLALVLAAAFRRARDEEPTGQAAVFGLAALLSILAAPLCGIHMYLLALPAVLFVPLWLHRRGRSRLAFRVATVPWVIAALSDLLGSRIGLLGLGMSAWCAWAAVLLTVEPPTPPASASRAPAEPAPAAPAAPPR